MKRKRLLATAIPAILFATTAYAVRQPEYLTERPLETAHGERGRVTRAVSYTAPRAAAKAWSDFLAAHGAWSAQWDADTGVASVIHGDGIKAPGASTDAAIAEQAARTVLAESLELFAPGAKLGDFALTNNVARGAIRTVTFRQTWDGLDVYGGHVSFQFKADRLFVIGSTATPTIHAAQPDQVVSGADLTSKAVGWIQGFYGGDPVVLDTGVPVLLPIVRDRGAALEHRVVVPVTIDLASPRAQWTVFVDAGTGDPLARHQRLAFAEGTIRYHVSDRHPNGSWSDWPAIFANHSADGTPVTSDATGAFVWNGALAAMVTPGLAGPRARVTTSGTPAATTTLSVSPDSGAVWDVSTDEYADAQLTSFIHANVVKTFVKNTMDPDLPWLDRAMPVRVNENDVCNAYSNLDDIHFFRMGTPDGETYTCQNTGRMADVVYHETGHSLHCQAMQDRLGIDCEESFDSALSEGISDYLAATITNDPAMGVGFFTGGPGPLRHIDPDGSEMVYPEDVSDFDVHVTGLIIAGALWDLRKALVIELGDTEGPALADDIFYGIISSGTDIAGSYVQALVVDDDDGDLSNGTPHKCAIDGAFSLHGLTDVAGAPGSLAPPALEALTISLTQPEGAGECPPPQIVSATASWHLRSDPTTTGTVDFTDGGATLTASLPEPAAGEVVEYQVTATLSNGGTKLFPLNSADRWYQAYVGPVTTIYCTDFEADPSSDGWTLDGDFEWGAPVAPLGGNDPTAAYSGDSVIGQNLAGNYQADATSSARSPEIDVTGFQHVHLQYRRWLASEDAEYDQSNIVVDGETLWTNLQTSSGNAQHLDGEWRFHDVDVTEQAADGALRITFEHTSDRGLEFGGWSVDDFCVVAVQAGAASCGDGVVDETEMCDDGNAVDGDGCNADCLGDGVDGGCCSTGGDGATAPLLLGFATLGALGLRRRRRA